MAKKFPKDHLFMQNELAEYLHLKVSTIQRMRYKNTGPIFCKLGNRIRYRMEDVQEWLKENRNTHFVRKILNFKTSEQVLNEIFENQNK